MKNGKKFRASKKVTKSIAVLVLVTIFGFTSTGCENNGDNSSGLLGVILGMVKGQPENSAPNTGTIKITFHDAPPTTGNIQKINMRIVRTEIIDATGNKTVISNTPHSFDLLQLTANNPMTLAHTRVPAGTYDQIRLILDDTTSITFTDGTTQPLKVPSGQQTGIKITGSFTIPAGLMYTLDIDLNPAQSVHFAPGQGYMLKPVIKILGSTPLVGIYHYDGSSINSASLILETKLDRTFRIKNSNSTAYDITGTFFYDSLEQRMLFYPRYIACPSCGWAPQLLSAAPDIPYPSILVFRVNSYGANFMNVKRIDKNTGLNMPFSKIATYQFP